MVRDKIRAAQGGFAHGGLEARERETNAATSDYSRIPQGRSALRPQQRSFRRGGASSPATGKSPSLSQVNRFRHQPPEFGNQFQPRMKRLSTAASNSVPPTTRTTALSTQKARKAQPPSPSQPSHLP